MSSERPFIGRSGQLAVLAELLARQCNGAIPEVDLGMDIFAFQDAQEEMARLQVKTARAEAYKRGDGHSAQFSIPFAQLSKDDKPPLHYVLAVRLEERFVDFLVIPRTTMLAYFTGARRFGTRAGEELHLTIQFRESVVCGDIDLTAHRGDWKALPPLSARS